MIFGGRKGNNLFHFVQHLCCFIFPINFSIISTYKNEIVRMCLLAVCFHFYFSLYFNEVIARSNDMRQMKCAFIFLLLFQFFSLSLSFSFTYFTMYKLRLHSTECVHHQCERTSLVQSIYRNMHGMEKSSHYIENAIVALMCISLITVKNFYDS